MCCLRWPSCPPKKASGAIQLKCDTLGSWTIMISERPKPIFLPIPKFRQFRYRQKGYQYQNPKSLHTDTETETETERQIICKEMKPVLPTYWIIFISKWLMAEAKKNISLISVNWWRFFFCFVYEMNKNLVIFKLEGT